MQNAKWKTLKHWFNYECSLEFFGNFRMVILWKTEQSNGELISYSDAPFVKREIFSLNLQRQQRWKCILVTWYSKSWKVGSIHLLHPQGFKAYMYIKGSFLSSTLILLSLLLVLWLSNFNYIFCSILKLRNDGLCAHFLLLSLVMDIFILDS